MDLLERDRELDGLRSAYRDAVAGHGSVVAISGEAGIGKTELVRTFVGERGDQTRVLWGGCDDLSTPRTLGPFRDIAIQVGGHLKDLLASGGSRGDLLDAVYEVFDATRPATIAVVEDLHWADGATLDVIKFLGRRIDHMSTVMILTYRTDEVEPDHPLRLAIGDLPAGSVHRLPLSPLSPSAVASLAAGYTGSSDELYEATAGNPFLVTEALATPGLTASAGLRDAVRARASRLSTESRRLAEQTAVVPTQIERQLLDRIFVAAPDHLEECRRRGLLDYDDSWVWYRHELVRAAVHESLLDEQRRALNRAVLVELIASDADVARIVHHAREAADVAALAEFAPIAARQAAAAGSHREALMHFRTAAEHTAFAGDADRAALLSDYAVESYLASEATEALDVSEQALALWRELGELEQQGSMLRWQSRFHWWLGHAELSEDTGRAAVNVLESVPDSDALPMAYSNLAQLAMLAQDFQPAVEWSEKAIASARERDDQSTLAHALNNLGSARLRIGDLTGFDLLKESLEIALGGQFDDHAGRAYANLIWTALDYRMYDTADQYLREGLYFATKRDLSGSVHYMTSERGTLRLQRGDWAGAESDLRWVLQQPEQPGIPQMPALATLSRLAVRRGDSSAATTLGEAWDLAEPTGELQRLAPVAAARAEYAWLRQDLEACRGAVADTHRLAVEADQPWVTDELAFWMWRSGADGVTPHQMETPYATQIAGSWEHAARQWEEIGCPYEQATALFDAPGSEPLFAALEILDELGAAPAARLVRAKLRLLGVQSIPRGPRPQTRAHPAGLTPRQVDVLTRIARGLTNSEIAEELFVSRKTVDHHVSAILTKLGVASRHEATRIAIEQGLVDA